MKVFDPLYGEFSIPTFLEPIMLAPEVRRLSHIRLLNSLSPSLATLGEIRRFSHTLGVLRLALISPLDNFSIEERYAFYASVIVHDIGTPPFAHLFEYHLRERSGWNHEQIIRSVLATSHAPENSANQIFAGQTVQLFNLLRSSTLDLTLVESIITSRHPLSSLLFGSIDLDNLDNVARMSWSLGIPGGPEVAIKLARGLSVDNRARLLLPKLPNQNALQKWADLRCRAYEIIVFDSPTVASQAVLSKALKLALCNDVISEDEWHLTDERLLAILQKHPLTKDLISRDYLGILPTSIFAVHLKGTLRDYKFSDRHSCNTFVESKLANCFPGCRPLAYIFQDHGTFSKRLKFIDPVSNSPWSLGEESQSIVLYGFLFRAKRPQPSDCMKVLREILHSLKVTEELVLSFKIGDEQGQCNGQLTFNF